MGYYINPLGLYIYRQSPSAPSDLIVNKQLYIKKVLTRRLNAVRRVERRER